MKQTLVIIISLICLNSYSQTRQKTKMDSEAVKIDTVYQISLSKSEFLNLVNAIKSIDEKPSIINKWLEENIYNKTRLVANKEQPKK